MSVAGYTMKLRSAKKTQLEKMAGDEGRMGSGTSLVENWRFRQGVTMSLVSKRRKTMRRM